MDNSTWLGQKDSSNQILKHDHEEENNRRVMNELKILSQHRASNFDLFDLNLTKLNYSITLSISIR